MPLPLAAAQEAIRNHDHTTLSQLLASHPALGTAQNSQGNSLLYYCIHTSNTQAAQLLLAAGANPNLPNQENRRPLHDAFEFGAWAIEELLLNAGAELEFNYVAGKDLVDALEDFYQQNPGLLTDESTGIMAIEWAAYGNAAQAAQWFLSKGLSPNHQHSQGGFTALMAAAECNNVAFAQVLLAAGAGPNLPANDGRTPLHFACLCKYVEDTTPHATLLLQHGAQVNATANGYTPLAVLRATQQAYTGERPKNFAGLEALLLKHGARA